MLPERSILVLDLTPFGESLELVPALRALRAAYPYSTVVAASSTGTSQLLLAAGLVQGTIDLGSLRQYTSRILLKLARRTRRRHFDLVIDFSPQAATQILARLFLRTQTVSAITGNQVLGTLLGWIGLPVERSEPRSRYESVLQQFGLRLEDNRIQILPPRDEDERFEERLARAKFKGGEPLVLMHSAAAAERRGWPLAHFAELATRLSHNFGTRTIVADEPGDWAFTASIGPYLPPGAIIIDRPDALQLAAAMARASVVVTDSLGVARFVEELGAPVVVPRQRPTDQVYDEVAETLQASRAASLFKR